jgi:hypothetical protein
MHAALSTDDRRRKAIQKMTQAMTCGEKIGRDNTSRQSLPDHARQTKRGKSNKREKLLKCIMYLIHVHLFNPPN